MCVCVNIRPATFRSPRRPLSQRYSYPPVRLCAALGRCIVCVCVYVRVRTRCTTRVSSRFQLKLYYNALTLGRRHIKDEVEEKDGSHMHTLT